MTDKTGTPALNAAICEVMKAIPNVRKEGTNTHFNYQFASEAGFMRACQPAMAANGLCLTCSEVELLAGSSAKFTIARFTWRLAHTSGEEVTLQAIGYGADNQDKSYAKAHTMARKGTLRSLFLIPTGDDPDNDGPIRHDRQPPAEHHPSWTDDERRGFMGALGRLGLDYEKQVKPFCVAQDWGKPSTWPSEQRRQFVNDIESGNVQIS